MGSTLAGKKWGSVHNFCTFSLTHFAGTNKDLQRSGAGDCILFLIDRDKIAVSEEAQSLAV